MTIGEKICWYRKKQKLSQEELAARTGVSRQAVSKWELNEAKPDLDKVVILAQVFSITTDQLLSSDNPEQAASEEDPLRYHMGQPHTARRPRQSGPESVPEEELRRFGRVLGGLIRRKGYMAGYILSLYGLGPLIGGAIFSLLVGRMRSTADFFNGGSSWIMDPSFSGGDPFSFVNNSMSGFLSVFQLIGALLLLIGAAMIIGGIVLAQFLKKKMDKRD